jgi:8-oxo-dGTP pyrophosphatase MutT (NUDIX family)
LKNTFNTKLNFVENLINAQHRELTQKPLNGVKYTLTYEYLTITSVEILNFYLTNITTMIPYLVTYKKKYITEMIISNKKFNYLKSINFFDNLFSEYSSTEWEIPKGGKKYNETNINCAIREFEEETSLTKNNYKIINCVDPIHDIFIGTNNKEYRHIFYTALYNNNNNSDEYNHSNNEIDCVKWCSWNDINTIIRPYNCSKIKIITLLILFIINICNNYTHEEPIEAIESRASIIRI